MSSPLPYPTLEAPVTTGTAETRNARRALARRWAALRRIRELPGVTRLLLLTQLAFNIGFYLVVPFLAVHLAEDLMLAGWAVGVVLGVRTFSQQGLFVVGGALADRFGTKPVVLAGCAIRVAGFLVLATAGDLATVLLGAVLTGFAAALFSPAVESALADQGAALERRGVVTRAELFAMFAVCGELGAVAGPLLGALLLTVDFGLTCLAAAAAFVLILLAHLRWLPRTPGRHRGEPLLAGWGEVLGNRTFLVFAAAYSAYLLSYNQLYLALPVELLRATGGQGALGWMFALASVLVVVGQLPLAAWGRTRLGPGRALLAGFGLLSASFAVVAVCAPLRPPDGPAALVPAVAFVVLLTAGQMLAVPVAQDLVPRLARERRLGAHFGFLSSAGGLAVLVGGTAVGGLLDGARAPAPAAALPWALLAALPAAGGFALWLLSRRTAALTGR
ncbi:MFS transporter [Marinitenerispora sediminis]|uniref:MFS transporter n=1 Tax=Marinitenerispora sediminis TaxID=1931232 RepID=A0A368SZ15_9ACTN|nr:MFS transporter [Marinitenerispora sediminis]RCV47776.1 MFS transporter [Marinitenerispora sediminis]RCV48372.1 MFS transporter [Marinitenerispora sediminis]RCV50108.1 MFS transporter [Marinitenerispora sediminis]